MNWQPIIYDYGSLAFDGYNVRITPTVMWRTSTPVRDGMVGFKTVASRDLRGVLILSKNSRRRPGDFGK
jgi:hypothetical protein